MTPLASVKRDAPGATDPQDKAAPFLAASQRRTRREAAVAFWLSAFFPGCGHVYAGKWGRGLVWASLLLGLLVPGMISVYIVWSSFSAALLFWLGLTALVFLLASGAGAARLVLRGLALVPTRPVWVLEAFAALVALGVVLEVRLLLTSRLEPLVVTSSRLEPLYASQEEVTVLISGYVRPVHGDVILYRVPHAGAGESPLRLLGRVLAKPKDSIAARGGGLLVNGILLDLKRSDQRWALEKAGRAERRWWHSRGENLDPERQGERVDWRSGDWGPFVLPLDTLLVLSDEPGAQSTAVSGETLPSGTLVQKRDILGRVVR